MRCLSHVFSILVASSSDDLETAAQDADGHGRDIRGRQNARRTIRPKVYVVPAAGLVDRADQAPAEQISKRRILHSADNLAAIEAKRCQHFD